MPRLSTNVIIGKLFVSAALALLVSCGDNVQVVPRVDIPRGMRAVSVISDIGVVPGNHVDVLVVGNAQQASTVLENVEIAAADKGIGTATFFVSPDDANKFEFAVASTEQGKVRLRLRSTDAN